ncbi:Gfo/Idh/MocA family protein [Lacrimispora sp.]|uniref:Gfo/Idh/MocA family protein n=1 Tax=Lacrimispora sp. TaxID=2719234 RepID=UPI002899FE0E|nr:Gfo/Idh/MocA family oxidoreductase [Lacrimispora sp.]
MKKLNIAIIGTGFMGRAHSNGWSQLPKFFSVDYEIVLKAVAGRDEEKVKAFAEKWGYEEYTTDWRSLLERKDIDVIDILTPTIEHKDMAIAAIKAGKHVVCEKPCALTYKDAVEMAEAAEKAGVVTYLNHNYRKVPAIAFAKQMIENGKLGKIYHWRGTYLQDWIMDENFPLTWHLDKKKAGGGPLYDLSSHAVDLARFLIGEPTSVMAMCKTFVKERPVPGVGAATFSAGSKNDGLLREMLPVTVDDAAFMTLEFENGALGTIDSSRFAAGRKNYNCFEVYGSKGALCFNLERMNELEFYDNTKEPSESGYQSIIVTNGKHPYVGAWWPEGHIIGYEHTFVHAFYEFVEAIQNGTRIAPNFDDGAKIIKILQCAQKSSEEGRKIRVDEEL